MISDANNLEMEGFPDSLTHLKNISLKAALVCGDLTDNGEVGQWRDFESLFGLYGEGKLKIPVYETFGNHDGDTNAIVRESIKLRNVKRSHVNVSENGLFYSWNWGNNHFVSLGSYPGNGWDSTCNWCHYFKKSFRDPQNSLAFLEADLRKYAKKNTKVFLYFHYGWDDFSKLWWTEQEQERFYEVIKTYNITGIFTGHNHAIGYRTWKGIDIYSAGSPQANNQTGSFLYVQLSKDSMHVLERKYGRWGTNKYSKATLH
jgi:cytolysin (calcineurin-like family phosphatase)